MSAEARGLISFLVFVLVVVAISPVLRAQEDASVNQYEPNWESLEKRPAPEWFLDAKFGIFIHWGVYSVPAWTRKGGYAEWYYRGYRSEGSMVSDFHRRVYGEDFKYEDFAPMFKAELFDPAEWADFFKRAGARYVVLTSKHHDGYCLWPSEHRPGWNSVETGPKRDLVGDLTTAVRESGLKMGLYYSLAEWTHPLYTWDFPREENDVDRYVDEYMMPQFRDVVSRYAPSLIFVDGEWSHGYETWRAEELVAWVYNRPELRDEVIVNDRWGGDTRFKHGGYWATEYTEGLSDADKPWEECRGMGYSFGYNRNETVDEYLTSRELIRMLVRLVANGGNLLLNIGPTADGRIPAIMQERLVQIGQWLEVNGEAIYGTRRWAFAEEGEYVRYTQSKDNEQVFAFCMDWPGEQLNLRRLRPLEGSEIRMLGSDLSLTWGYDSREGLLIDLPSALRDDIKIAGAAAVAFCIEGKPSDMTNSPYIGTDNIRQVTNQLFVDAIGVVLSSDDPEADFWYTLDGSEPTFESRKYDGPIQLRESATVRAFAHREGQVRSLSVSARFVLTEYRQPDDPGQVRPGLAGFYYEEALGSLPDFSKLAVVDEGHVARPEIGLRKRDDDFACRFVGFIEIPESAVYNFYLRSDDGSRFYIGERVVVDNDGLHGAGEQVNGQIALAKGMHALTVEFFEHEGDQSLEVMWESPSIDKQDIPESAFFAEKP